MRIVFTITLIALAGIVLSAAAVSAVG